MFNSEDVFDSKEEAMTQFHISLFDDFAHLAKHKPNEFEALRTKLCDEMIQNAPERMQDRLRGLQFTIDMERRKSKSTLSVCLKLSRMMNDSLLELKEALSNPQSLINIRASQQSADIIPLFPNS